jgi:hypothetical protein
MLQKISFCLCAGSPYKWQRQQQSNNKIIINQHHVMRYTIFSLGVLSISSIASRLGCFEVQLSCYFFLMPDAAGPQAPKRLLAGCRVSGTFGELIANPDPARRHCVPKRLFGNVLNAVSHGKHRIQLDDGSLLECFSNRLRMESSSASIPPDALPVQSNVVNANAPPRTQEDIDAAEEQLIEAIEDSHEEKEHIVPPEHDDDDSTSEEHVALEGEGEATQPAAEVDPNGQMSGEIPTAAAQVEEVRTYAQWKERKRFGSCWGKW